MSDFKKPPYYAVIFTSIRTDQDDEGYQKMTERMTELAKAQAGFLGMESARSDIGITVSYWRDINAIKEWKFHSEHLLAQEYGKTKWYTYYKVRIAKIEHEYDFGKLKP